MAVAMAIALQASEASGQTILQKNDWRGRSFETFLPPLQHSVPWLDSDGRTKLPKRVWPIGWQANVVAPFALHRVATEAQGVSTAVLNVGRM